MPASKDSPSTRERPGTGSAMPHLQRKPTRPPSGISMIPIVESHLSVSRLSKTEKTRRQKCCSRFMNQKRQCISRHWVGESPHLRFRFMNAVVARIHWALPERWMANLVDWPPTRTLGCAPPQSNRGLWVASRESCSRDRTWGIYAILLVARAYLVLAIKSSISHAILRISASTAAQ